MKPLDARILDIYEALTPLERRLANVVLEHQRELAAFSATELARQAAVSKATAARLFRRLGYETYDEARRQSRALRHWGSPLALLDGLRQDEQGPGIGLHLQNEVANLTRTFEGLRPELLEQAIELLAGADRVWLIGFRASHPMAELAAFWMKYLRPGVALLPGSWMTFAEDVIDIKQGDAVLAVGMRRRPRMLRALLQSARDRGAGVVLLTDLSASATARLAAVVLRCHSRSAAVFDSYTAVASMVNLLLGGLARRLGDGVRGRLAQIEDLADQLDAFTVPGRGR
jgi:DNA-binding MurR/RpiR family transcriptional regulator